jgi:hypothetical protein
LLLSLRPANGYRDPWVNWVIMDWTVFGYEPKT